MPHPRNVIRIDNEEKRTHSWIVTLQRRGEIVVRSFADGVFGGKRKALEAALAHRDLLLSRHSDTEHQIWVRTRLRKNNRSGIPGVARYEVIDNPNTGHTYAFWLAFWVDEHGASRKRKFSVSRYGERQAKSLAIVERERQLHRVCSLKGHGQP
jgi:hypothetical protein